MLCSRFFGLFPWHPSCGNTPTPGGHSSRSLEAMDQAKPRVLVVDDDPLTRSLLSIALQSQAFEVIPAGDAGTALEHVRSEAPEIVILDLRLPGLDGMEALRKFKEIAPELPVVILTGYGDVPSAVEAMRLGAYDFLTKPVEPAKILVVVRRALKHQALGTELKELRRLGQRDALRWLMGRGQEIQQVIQQIKQRSEEHTSELQSRENLVCRLLLPPPPRSTLFPYTTLFRSGAYDFLTKPVEPAKILVVVRRALKHQALGTELKELRRLGQRDALRWLMGRGQEIQQVIQQIKQVADSNFTILIQGETGTGKEVVARSIHQLSARREKPFVALDCGATPETLTDSELFGYEKGAFTGADRRREGHFQLAQGGTLFLDEIVNLPFPTQAKLLRTLEARAVQVLGAKGPLSVDVRIIAAANVPMDGEIRAGRFRQDLYYRLNEFVIVVPALRERMEDIVYLAERFLAEASMELQRPVRGISDEGVQVLLGYHWPGNVRELRNVIRRAVLLSSDLIEPGHLLPLPANSPEARPVEVSAFLPPGLPLREMARMAAAEAERRAIRQALRTARGNKSEAARILGTDFKTLHLKMRRYGIRPGELS